MMNDELSKIKAQVQAEETKHNFEPFVLTTFHLYFF